MTWRIGEIRESTTSIRPWRWLVNPFAVAEVSMGGVHGPLLQCGHARESLQYAGECRTRHFATTQWSIVLAAGDADGQDYRTALAQLCESYWYPLYAYVRRHVDDVQEAQDLTQAFFSHLLEKQTIARADHNRGRFRDFLLASFKNFLANQRQRAQAAKRGGGKTESVARI